jgi:hypothetical protein
MQVSALKFSAMVSSENNTRTFNIAAHSGVKSGRTKKWNTNYTIDTELSNYKESQTD